MYLSFIRPQLNSAALCVLSSRDNCNALYRRDVWSICVPYNRRYVQILHMGAEKRDDENNTLKINSGFRNTDVSATHLKGIRKRVMTI
jgi:hypothetical protein